MKPLCVELFCGTFGWSAGWLALGGAALGFDIEHLAHHGPVPDGAQLVLQDVLTLDGAQFKDAGLILASPPCQAYSYRAMPWKRAKALPPPSNELFDACFRIQREACAAAGRHIPMVVENVCGAQKWVGCARWHYGSFYLWGDVPALMPVRRVSEHNKIPPHINESIRHGKSPGRWTNPLEHDIKVPAFRFDGSGRSFQSAAVAIASSSIPADGFKTAGMNWSDRSKRGQDFTRIAGMQSEGVKGSADQLGGDRRTWFDGGLTKHGSKSTARKAASAAIARIPYALSFHIARSYWPEERAVSA